MNLKILVFLDFPEKATKEVIHLGVILWSRLKRVYDRGEFGFIMFSMTLTDLVFAFLIQFKMILREFHFLIEEKVKKDLKRRCDSGYQRSDNVDCHFCNSFCTNAVLVALILLFVIQ